jgi:hypothetical protein
MALLKRRNTAPPGGFTYLQTETQFTMKGENEDQLIDFVIAHRQYRNLAPTDRESVRKEIERQICTRLGYGDCKPEGKNDPWVAQDGTKPVIGMTQMIAFSKAAMAFVASGGELAPMEEVNRRAAICLRCPLNQPVSGCSCGIFYKAIAAAVPQSRTIDGLNLCMACSCSLVAKVNLTEDQVRISNEGRKIDWPAQECWQKEIQAAT